MKQATRRLACRMLGACIALGLAGSAAAQTKAPYNVAVKYDGATHSATLSWTSDAPLAYGFAIERRLLGSATWSQVAFKSEPVRSYTDRGLAPLKRYEYRVKAYRSGARSDFYPSAAVATAVNFPYNAPYPFGIRPSNFSQDQMNADVRDMYTLWRATYVTSAGAGSGGKRVYKPAEGGGTVSEGQGYGMLISVFMADDDNGGKADFDAMLVYYRAHMKTNADGSTRNLMDWSINADGSTADPWVAPDGDLDAAFSLLVADHKWGSGNGNPNYLGEAQGIINALQKYVVFNRVTTASKLIANADKDLTWQEGAGSYTMSSYQMVGYMRQFASASDSTRAAQWLDTLKSGYEAFNYFYKTNPGTALTPFTFLTQPGLKQYLKGSKGYTFGPDSCRVPWRIGMDYIWHGNANSSWAHGLDPAVSAALAQDMPKVNVNWFMGSTGGNPSAMWYTYQLNGTPASTIHWGQRHTAGSMAAGALTDVSSQQQLNTLYAWMRQQIPGQDYNGGGYRVPAEYFGDTVLMLNMIMVTGNMPDLPEVLQ